MTSGAELAKGKQLGVLPLHLALSLALCCHFPSAGEEATLPKPGRRDMVGWGQSPFLCVCQCSVNYGGGGTLQSVSGIPGAWWKLVALTFGERGVESSELAGVPDGVWGQVGVGQWVLLPTPSGPWWRALTVPVFWEHSHLVIKETSVSHPWTSSAYSYHTLNSCFMPGPASRASPYFTHLVPLQGCPRGRGGFCRPNALSSCAKAFFVEKACLAAFAHLRVLSVKGLSLVFEVAAL